MKSFFVLQFRMLSRQMQETGLPPVFGFPLFLVVFAGVSLYLFQNTPFAPYLYLLVAVSVMVGRSEKSRIDFLKSCYSRPLYYKIRWMENMMIALPFILILVFHTAWIPVLILLMLSGLLIFTAHNLQLNVTLPTPFSKHLFEFATGFRRTFIVQFFACFLTVMAIKAGNENLGLFSLALQFLIYYSFYLEPENEFYIWVHKYSPASFLLRKTTRAILQSSLFTLPVLAVLLLFMEGDWPTVLLFQAGGYMFMVAVILMKYASYPDKMYLPYLVLLGFCIYFPPLLIGLLPFFFYKSKQHLKEILR